MNQEYLPEKIANPLQVEGGAQNNPPSFLKKCPYLKNLIGQLIIMITPQSSYNRQ